VNLKIPNILFLPKIDSELLCGNALKTRGVRGYVIILKRKIFFSILKVIKRGI